MAVIRVGVEVAITVGNSVGVTVGVTVTTVGVSVGVMATVGVVVETIVGVAVRTVAVSVGVEVFDTIAGVAVGLGDDMAVTETNTAESAANIGAYCLNDNWFSREKLFPLALDASAEKPIVKKISPIAAIRTTKAVLGMLKKPSIFIFLCALASQAFQVQTLRLEL